MACENLLRPDIVEPFHRNGVPEPEMRRLVRDEVRAREFLHVRRRLAEKHPGFVEENSARVLHAAELEARHDDAVVFREGHRDTRVVLHPIQRVVDLPVDFRQLRQLRRVGFPVVNVDGLSVAVETGDIPPSRRKREEIGGQEGAFRKENVLPPGRDAFFLNRAV